MIIDHGRRFVFIHVPRTGGFSAYNMLGGQTPGAMHPRRSDIEENYFSFGFIRNPWDRMYSAFRKQRTMPKYHGFSFKRYLLEGIADNGIRFEAMYFLAGCDFIGRYENLQSDWDYILDRLNMPAQTLPHLNQCGDDDYQNHYDNEMIDHIVQNHNNDIQYGRYSYEP